MRHSNFYELVSILISRNQLKKAIRSVIDSIHEIRSDESDCILLISMKLHSLEQANIKGIIDWNMYQNERQNIANKVLKLARLIDEN